VPTIVKFSKSGVLDWSLNLLKCFTDVWVADKYFWEINTMLCHEQERVDILRCKQF